MDRNSSNTQSQFLNNPPRIVLAMLFPKTATQEEIDREFAEAESLVTTYGGFIVVKKIQFRGQPDYRTYLGKGKVEEIVESCDPLGIDIVVINNSLKASQMYNIVEKFEKAKLVTQVWDRVDLILKIFEKHANTNEARLQIELAAIKHMGPRIFGMGMELSRQGGGIGGRGIGETNTSIMKTHLSKLEKTISDKIEKYKKVREGQRNARKRKGFKQAAIVGYTNAGKSSLLNVLTQKGAYVKNELFATLDTRTAKVYLPEVQQEIVLTDTIGFIKNLPPQLIQAFKSTLEETVHADYLIHVIDISNPAFMEQIEVVHKILEELNIDPNMPELYVFNKIDNLEEGTLEVGGPADALREEFDPVFISTKKRIGLDELKKRVAANYSQEV